jgi:zinc transport system substrate-binding protein
MKITTSKVDKPVMNAFASLLLLLLLMTSCTGKSSKNNRTVEKPVITVTIEPQRYFTQAIAGDKFNVVSIVPKGSSPETYDPIPQQLVSLAESKAYLRIGYVGFEQVWMERLMKNAPHLQVFDTSTGIDLILDHTHHGHEKDAGHIHSGVEPHLWSSPANVLIIARNTFKALCTLDKENEAYYLVRYDSLCQQIQHLDTQIRRKLSNPQSSKAFLIYHPTLSYFARDYNLQQYPIEENGKEPSPTYLKSLIDISKAEKIHVIFVQPEFDHRNAETIARQTGTVVTHINPLSYDWEKELLRIAEVLAKH